MRIRSSSSAGAASVNESGQTIGDSIARLAGGAEGIDRCKRDVVGGIIDRGEQRGAAVARSQRSPGSHGLMANE